MTKATRARYTLEFKQEAVRLVEAGQSQASVAKTLGIVEQTLFNWIKANRQGQLKGADSKAGECRADVDCTAASRAGPGEDGARYRGKSDGVLRQGCEVRYAFIERHRQMWPIAVQCRVLKVSISGYHGQVARQASIAPRRHFSDEALLAHIKAIHTQTRRAYGRPRILRELRKDGVRVGKQRLQTLMHQHGIRAKSEKRFKVTTDSNHDLPIALNLLDRQFAVNAPDKVWAGDITTIATDEGWLFLAVVIDLFSRQVVGWSMRQDMHRDIVIDALRMAWIKRHPDRHAGLVFHSDRGSRYASDDFRAVLNGYGIAASMSRRSNCWDNACSETLFGSLKVERLHGQHFVTRRHAKGETFAWLLWYNRSRLHSPLNYVSPMQFEQHWLADQVKHASP